MIQYFPIVTGSLVVLGNVSVSGSINASGSIALSGSIASASYALSASNAATASSADNFLTRGTLTAQTLVVQTITSSVDFVTGSTRFGSTGSNTHQFTGSVSVTGSFAVVTTGTELQVGATGVNLGNVLTDSHIISGSLTVNPNGLFVSSSGRVGVGTTNPDQLVTIIGSGSAIATKISTVSDHASFFEASSNNSAVTVRLQSQTLPFVGTLTNTTFDIVAGGNVIIRTTGSGLVGIGTSSPSTTLDVRFDSSSTDITGSGGSSLRLLNSQAANTNDLHTGIWFRLANGISNRNGYIKMLNDATNSTGDFAFILTQTGTESERVRFKGNGRVGIGTSTPSGSRLHVFIGNDGGSGIPGTILATSNGANDIVRFQDGTTTVAVVKNDGRFGMGTTNTSTEANLHLGANGASEGGQLILQRATSYASASHLDNYQNLFRVMSGNDTTSNLVRMQVDMTNGTTTVYGPIVRDSGTISITGTAQTIFALPTDRTRVYLLQVSVHDATASSNYRWFGVIQSFPAASAYLATSLSSQTIAITFSSNNIQVATTNGTSFGTTYWSITQLM